MRFVYSLIFLLCITSASFSIAEYDLFQEDFDDGVADGFFTDCPIWEVSPQGTYHVEDEGFEVFCWSFAGESWWEDYRYSLSIKSQGSTNQLCAFRVQENGDCYLLNVRSAPWNDVGVAKLIGGVHHQLFNTSLTNSNGIWHDFEVSVIGSSISFVLDGQDIFTYADNNNPYLLGKIGVVSYTGGVIQEQILDVDDVSVTSFIVPVTKSTMSSVKSLYR